MNVETIAVATIKTMVISKTITTRLCRTLRARKSAISPKIVQGSVTTISMTLASPSPKLPPDLTNRSIKNDPLMRRTGIQNVANRTKKQPKSEIGSSSAGGIAD